MNWYPVLDGFHAHLQASVGSVPVSLGGDAKIPNASGVIILRGPSVYGDPRRSEESTTQVWVECWEYSENSDFSVGYSALAALEEKVVDAIRSFAMDGQSISGYRARAKLEGVEGDGDVFRPSIGSRLSVTIHMKPA